MKNIYLAVIMIGVLVFAQFQTAYGKEGTNEDIAMEMEALFEEEVFYHLELSDGYDLSMQVLLIEYPKDNVPGEVTLLYEPYLNSDLEIISLNGVTINIPDEIRLGNFRFTVKNLGGFYNLSNAVINIPETVVSAEEGSFADMNNVELAMPASLVSTGKGFLTGSRLSKLTVSTDNPVYKAEDNSLYSIDGKILYHLNIIERTIQIKDGIQIIKDGSLFLSTPDSNIQELILPDSVTSIEQNIMDIPYLEFKGKKPPKIKYDNWSNSSGNYDNYILVPKGTKGEYAKIKSENGNQLFYSLKIEEENLYLNKVQAFLKKMSTKAKQKAGLSKPQGLTEKQWNGLIKKASQITSNAGSNSEKAWLIYQWVTQNFTYDYTAVGNSKLEDGRTQYLMLLRTNYNVKLNYTYTAYENKKGVQYAFVNVTNALMRAAGVPSYTILAEGTNQAWGSHFPGYRNMVYYGDSWHLINTGEGCINYIDDYGKGIREEKNLVSFDMSWKGWTLAEKDIPMIIEEVLPAASTGKSMNSGY